QGPESEPQMGLIVKHRIQDTTIFRWIAIDRGTASNALHAKGLATRETDTEPDAPFAINRHNRPYSITSSARSSIDGGIARPSAVAVLRFTTISNLVGNCTGRWPGFSPRRMRLT